MTDENNNLYAQGDANNSVFTKKNSKFSSKIKDYEDNLMYSQEDYFHVKQDSRQTDKKVIKFNILYTFNGEQRIKNFEIQVGRKLRVSELMTQGIELFNEYCRSSKTPLRLQTVNFDSYCIKPSEASGVPDYDMPKVDKNSLVFNTDIEEMSLIYGKKDLEVHNENSCPKICIIL